MKVRDVMTREVISVPADASVLQAGELMVRHDISGLPVLAADGRLVGIVTERDFLRPGRPCGDLRPRALQVIAGQSAPPERYPARKVAEVMTPSPITVGEETPLEEVVRVMDSQSIKRLPVLRDGRLVGIVARGDLLRALVQSLRRVSEAVKEQEAARARLTELERQSWLQRTRSDH
jgi:CBS domain-containing protein